MWEPKTQGPSSIRKLWSVAGKVWRLLASSQSLPLALNISPRLCSPAALGTLLGRPVWYTSSLASLYPSNSPSLQPRVRRAASH